MIGQIELVDYLRELEVVNERKNPKTDCSGCKCGGSYWKNREQENCEHWERRTCPVSRERIGAPYVNYFDGNSSYYESNCADCSYSMHIDNDPHCHSGAWHKGNTHYMSECSYYKQSSMKMTPCLNGMMIYKWDDGTMFCPICEANGCDDCYREFERRLEEEDD